MINIAILIPARLEGVRLPRKVLMDFFGFPMIEHVRRRAIMNHNNSEVYVVSGDQEVLEVVSRFQGKSIETYIDHENGTSRCAEAASKLENTHFIVAQGDEILLHPDHVNLLIDAVIDEPKSRMLNCVARLKSNDELHDESVVKCLISMNHKILMMFRKPPNSSSKENDFEMYFKVLGLFAFEKNLLQELSQLKPTNFEQRESIEQMRLLENGIEITAIKVERSYPSVNVTKDISEVLDVIATDSDQGRILELITNETL